MADMKNEAVFLSMALAEASSDREKEMLIRISAQYVELMKESVSRCSAPEPVAEKPIAEKPLTKKPIAEKPKYIPEWSPVESLAEDGPAMIVSVVAYFIGMHI